jgi:hypothetical protein
MSIYLTLLLRDRLRRRWDDDDLGGGSTAGDAWWPGEQAAWPPGAEHHEAGADHVCVRCWRRT